MNMETQRLGISGDAFEARLMEAAVLQIPPNILPMDARCFGEVLIAPAAIFQCEQDLDFQREKTLTMFELNPNLRVFKLSIKHAFHNKFLP